MPKFRERLQFGQAKEFLWNIRKLRKGWFQLISHCFRSPTIAIKLWLLYWNKWRPTSKKTTAQWDQSSMFPHKIVIPEQAYTLNECMLTPITYIFDRFIYRVKDNYIYFYFICTHQLMHAHTSIISTMKIYWNSPNVSVTVAGGNQLTQTLLLSFLVFVQLTRISEALCCLTCWFLKITIQFLRQSLLKYRKVTRHLCVYRFLPVLLEMRDSCHHLFTAEVLIWSLFRAGGRHQSLLLWVIARHYRIRIFLHSSCFTAVH